VMTSIDSKYGLTERVQRTDSTHAATREHALRALTNLRECRRFKAVTLDGRREAIVGLPEGKRVGLISATLVESTAEELVTTALNGIKRSSGDKR